jgi:4-azaleucine resistance transporter AzlC
MTGMVATTATIARKAPGDVRAALRDTAPAAAAMVPLGLAFGVFVTQSGLRWWWTPVISAAIFGGTLEFLLVGFVVAAVPLTTVALTALLLQGRHVFYCLSFPLHRVEGRLRRLYARYALIDEAYALTTAPAAQQYSSRRILSMQLLMQAYWVGGGIVGAVLGTVVPSSVRGLDFALVGLFGVLAVDAYRAQRDAGGMLAALACAAAAALVVPSAMLLVAMSLFVALLLLRSTVGRRSMARG